MKLLTLLKKKSSILLFACIFFLSNCQKADLANDTSKSSIDMTTANQLGKKINKLLIEKKSSQLTRDIFKNKPIIKFASIGDTSHTGMVVPVFANDGISVKALISYKVDNNNQVVAETLFDNSLSLSNGQVREFNTYLNLMKENGYSFLSSVEKEVSTAYKKIPSEDDVIQVYDDINTLSSSEFNIQSTNQRNCRTVMNIEFVWVSYCSWAVEQGQLIQLRFALRSEIENYLGAHNSTTQNSSAALIQSTVPHITMQGSTTHINHQPLGDFSNQGSALDLIKRWVDHNVLPHYDCLGSGNIYIRMAYFNFNCSYVTDGENPPYPGEGHNPNRIPLPTFLQHVNFKPFKLIPNIPCNIVNEWLSTATFEPNYSVADRLDNISANPHIVPGLNSSIVARIQRINSAHSATVNMDYFSVNISQMPIMNGVRVTPENLLAHIRININQFVNNHLATFQPYSYFANNDSYLWQSTDPLGAIIAIDMLGPDNGSVVVSNYAPDGWTFTTIYDPRYNRHPVSGNRDFGYVQNSNGSYTFYTRGVDRLTSWDVTSAQDFLNLPFGQGDALWRSFQERITTHVNRLGGTATINTPQIHRPDWKLVLDVLDGIKPLSALSTDCN